MGLFASPCTSTGTTTHSHRQRRRFAALALAALLTMSALALVGCASNHPITKSGEQCASCHSDGRAAVEGTGSASATETGLTFAVESGADEVNENRFYPDSARELSDNSGNPQRQTQGRLKTLSSRKGTDTPHLSGMIIIDIQIQSGSGLEIFFFLPDKQLISAGGHMLQPPVCLLCDHAEVSGLHVALKGYFRLSLQISAGCVGKIGFLTVE